jgi:regulator of sirC expression with transglutaminase-like and TPR domain
MSELPPRPASPDLAESDLEQQWAKEAIRRRDEVRTGEVKPVPAEEVYSRIENLLGALHHGG